MKNFKNIAYSLVAIISFSLISAGAYAGGISIRFGGYGHGYHQSHHSYSHHRYGYNRYRSSVYSHYRKPIVTYRHHYRPYYGYRHHSYFRGHGYRNYGHSYYGSRHQSYGRSSNHNRQDSHDSGHGKNKVGHIQKH